jgi:hypothetical protein
MSSSRVSSRRLRTVSPVASSSCRALGDTVCAHRAEQVMRGARLVARVDSAALAGQPLSVQVVGDGVLADEQSRADLGVRQALAREPRDLGLLAVNSSRVSRLRLQTCSPVATSLALGRARRTPQHPLP